MIFVKEAYAQCPACIVTVGGGLLIAKKLGIDDLLVSIWISALNTAIALWIASSIKKKLFNNPILWSLIFYIFTIVYLYYSKQLFHPKNTFFGLDKIIAGMTIGLLVALFSTFIEKLIRKRNNNKVLFYYQKVMVPLTLLIIITIIFKALL